MATKTVDNGSLTDYSVSTGSGTVDDDTQRMVLATDVALPAGTNNIGDVDVLSVVPGTSATSLGKAEDAAHASGDTGVMALSVRKDTAAATSGTDGDYQPLITNSSGALHVAVASGAVTASGSISQTTATTGGYSAMDLIDIDESEDEVKATAGTLGGFILTNLAASTRFVRFYNATAASTTVGTTAAEIVIAIPAGAGVVMPVGNPGIAFGTAICVAATTGVAANDTGAPGGNEVVGTIFYA